MSVAFDYEHLRSVPLFSGFTDRQLDAVRGLFRRAHPGDGCLFERGAQAEALYVLADGVVTLDAGDDETYELHPVAVIGELGALTGRARNTTATMSEGAVVYAVDVNPLLELFEADPDLGLGFQQNLMNTLAEKIARDQTRLQDMRRNIVRTQKAMKEMRELLLDSADTAISQPLHDVLDTQIRHNRRVNYRVSPPASLSSVMRLDDGVVAQVVQVSRTHVSFRQPSSPPAAGARVTAAMSLGGPEIPVSGKVLRVVSGRVDVELDPMIEPFSEELEGYLTRIQMLDFLV